MLSEDVDSECDNGLIKLAGSPLASLRVPGASGSPQLGSLLKAENITLADGRTAAAPCMLISPETQESHFQQPMLERFGKTVLV